ncbi:MAG: hypothetical protein MJ201_03500 [Mycoplasmoidaceae bacterium]|nr:hypothetical protein [Mycoplasmoidaceae bacterium]
MDGAIKNMYMPKKYVPLYSASALISKELLKTSGNKFPEGCLEDVFLESIALRNSFTGVVLPTTPSGQAFDKNVKAWHKRNLRIND